MQATVHVYTGDKYHPEMQTWPVEPIEGEVTWDEGGVRVRRPNKEGLQIFQIPWTSLKYITWRQST